MVGSLTAGEPSFSPAMIWMIKLATAVCFSTSTSGRAAFSCVAAASLRNAEDLVLGKQPVIVHSEQKRLDMGILRQARTQRLLPAQRILHAAHGVLGLPDLFFRGAFNLHFSVAKQAPEETSEGAFGLSGRPFDPVLVHGQYPLFFSADLVTASAPADTSLPMPAVVLQAWSERGAARQPRRAELK